MQPVPSLKQIRKSKKNYKDNYYCKRRPYHLPYILGEGIYMNLAGALGLHSVSTYGSKA